MSAGVTFRDLVSALRRLEIEPGRAVIAHASLSAFGQVAGGAATMAGALLATFKGVMMPAFTYKTMVIPEVGPPENGLTYGSGKDQNRMAEFYREDMPADRLMGAVAEALRRQPRARRSAHPILSFTGVNVDRALEAQTLKEPLAPIGVLQSEEGWVLLLGVNHTVNTSIHYAEQAAGRKSFTRWALTAKGVVECGGWPACSQGFEAIAPHLAGLRHQTQAGDATIQAFPLVGLVETVRSLLATDPLALLCAQPECERCNAVRAEVARRAEEAREADNPSE